MADTSWTKDRPVMPGMGAPDSLDGTLEWADVAAKLSAAKNYWICTASDKGVPHAVPMWAAFVDETVYVSMGGRRANRNVASNPQITIHLESGTEVVIVEGKVDSQATIDPDTYSLIDAQFQEKYDWKPSNEAGYDGSGDGWKVVRPSRIIAWTSFPADATRWTIADTNTE